jgi:hypothetical protein
VEDDDLVPPHFFEASEDAARRVIEADGLWPTYDAGIAFSDVAMNAMTEQPQGKYLPWLPSRVYLIWGALTDEVDAPGRGSPEQDAAAVTHMKRTASEWLEVSRSPQRRDEYLDRWVHDECGYAREGG